MPESIHYLDVAIRLQFDPAQLPNILKVGRQLTQENVPLPLDDEDPENESTRPMTDEEASGEITSVQDCIDELLRANPLLDQLKMDIIASVIGGEQSASESDELPSLDLAVDPPRHLETVESDDWEAEEEDPLDEFNDSGLFLCRWPTGPVLSWQRSQRETQLSSLMSGVP